MLLLTESCCCSLLVLVVSAAAGWAQGQPAEFVCAAVSQDGGLRPGRRAVALGGASWFAFAWESSFTAVSSSTATSRCLTCRPLAVVLQGMWHVFQASLEVPEAQEAAQEMATFFKQHLQ